MNILIFFFLHNFSISFWTSNSYIPRILDPRSIDQLSFVDILRFIYYRFFNKLFYTNKLEVNYTISEEDNSIFKEIQQNGYSIIDNFISKDECNSIIQEIDLFCDNRFDEVTLFEGFERLPKQYLKTEIYILRSPKSQN